jgi:hypothetical protein
VSDERDSRMRRESDEGGDEDEGVEAHMKVRQAKVRQAEDEPGGDEVEAHMKVRQADGDEDDGDGDVEAHMKVRQ